MRGKLLLLAIFLIIILIAIFFINPEEETSYTDICKEIEFPNLKSICYASVSKNLEACNEFNWNYKEFCAKAVLSKIDVNEKFCNGINDETIKNICLRKLAVLSGNLKFCKDDSCYFLYSTVGSCNLIDIDYLKYTCLANVTKDLNNCNKIEDEYEKIDCKSLFSTSLDVCKDSEGHYVPPCVIIVSKNSKNWGYCLKLPTEYLRAKCVASASDSMNTCNNLKEEKDLCKIIFIGKNLELYYE